MFIFSNQKLRPDTPKSKSSYSEGAAPAPLMDSEISSPPKPKSMNTKEELNTATKASDMPNDSRDQKDSTVTAKTDNVDKTENETTPIKQDASSSPPRADNSITEPRAVEKDEIEKLEKHSNLPSFSPPNGEDGSKSDNTKSSSVAHSQSGDSTVHPLPTELPIKEAKAADHPEMEGNQERRLTRSTSIIVAPKPMETIDKVLSESKDPLQGTPTTSVPHKQLNEPITSAMPGADPTPALKIAPRSYRHHHAVRKARKIILQKPILGALLGRQLGETTKPVLDLLASGQNMVPIDDAAMAEMKSVSPVPITNSEV